jgi:hypothetical protein
MRNGTRDLEEIRHGISLLLPKFRSIVQVHFVPNSARNINFPI